MKAFYEVVFRNDMIIEDYKDFDNLKDAIKCYADYVGEIHFNVNEGIRQGYELEDLLSPSTILKVLFEDNDNQVILAYCNVTDEDGDAVIKSHIKYAEMDKALDGWWD